MAKNDIRDAYRKQHAARPNDPVLFLSGDFYSIIMDDAPPASQLLGEPIDRTSGHPTVRFHKSRFPEMRDKLTLLGVRFSVMQRTSLPSGPWRVVGVAQQYDLSRFIEAHTIAYADALAELKDGAKFGHWIWYLFPQIAGLGISSTSQKYAIKDIGEARAYYLHPLLGSHYRECCKAVMAYVGKRSAQQIFGDLDAIKLRSSLTLFLHCGAPGAAELCKSVLDTFFGGVEDDLTITRIRR